MCISWVVLCTSPSHVDHSLSKTPALLTLLGMKHEAGKVTLYLDYQVYEKTDLNCIFYVLIPRTLLGKTLHATTVMVTRSLVPSDGFNFQPQVYEWIFLPSVMDSKSTKPSRSPKKMTYQTVSYFIKPHVFLFQMTYIPI